MSAAAPQTNLSQAANRWWRMTNNLVATAVILVAGLAIGREVVHGWWQVRAPQTRAADELLATRPVITGPLTSEPFTGTTDEATAALAERCRTACEAHRPLLAIGKLEEAGLNASRRLGDYDGFELYLAEGEPPLMAAVSKAANGGVRDVYCWGLALPTDEQDAPRAWNLSISAPGMTPAQEQ